MGAILGVSAFYHDSAAAVVVDGRIVAAAQEERFTRRKGDQRFPTNAIAYCLHEAGLRPSDLLAVAYYEKPITKFGRLPESFLAVAPRGLRSWSAAVPIWLRQRLWVEQTIRGSLCLPDSVPVLYPEHHESHAASAFFPSPYAGHRPTAAVSIDGWNDSRRGDVPTFDEDLARFIEIQRGEGGPGGIVTALLIGTATGRFARGLARRIGQARPPPDTPSLEEVGRRAARRWMRSVEITQGVAEAAGVETLFVVQPVSVYGFARGTHPLAGNSEYEELRDIAGSPVTGPRPVTTRAECRPRYPGPHDDRAPPGDAWVPAHVRGEGNERSPE